MAGTGADNVSPDPRMVVNVQRLNDFMDRHRLSAVIARSGQNFSYLAGFGSPGTLARLLDLTDSPRGVMLLWPRHGEPTLVLNGAAVPVAAETPGSSRSRCTTPTSSHRMRCFAT